MSFRNMTLLIFVTTVIGCSKSSQSPQDPQLVVSKLGEIGTKVDQGSLPANYVTQIASWQSIHFTNLSFDFTKDKSVQFFSFYEAPCGGILVSNICYQIETCSLSVPLSDEDLTYIQTTLAQVPICQYSISASSQTIACPMSAQVFPSGEAPFISSGTTRLELEQNSICSGAGTYWTSNCDDILVNQVSSYLSQKITSAHAITCKSQY